MGAIRRDPIRLWSAVGAASVVLVVVVLSQWALDGITTVDPGDDPYGGTDLVLLRILEWGQFAVFLALAWHFVVRPLLRRSALGFDGLFVLAAVLLNFWDPLDNYWTFSFQYNAHHLNVGSWGGHIPGWHGADPELWAVPVAFVFGAYTWAFFAAARGGCAVLSWVTTHRPQWRPWRGWVVVFVACAAIAAVSEIIYLTIGAIANLRTPAGLTVGHGGPDGWPIYNPVLFGFTWTALTWLRWTRDAEGLSFVERGALGIAAPRRVQTVLRFLAIFAFLEVAYIGCYFLPWNLLAATGDPLSGVPSYFPMP